MRPDRNLYRYEAAAAVRCVEEFRAEQVKHLQPLLGRGGEGAFSVSMGMSLHPLTSDGGFRVPVADLLPIASVFTLLPVGLIAFGELYTSFRMYEYIGALAPKGQEGLFLGYVKETPAET